MAANVSESRRDRREVIHVPQLQFSNKIAGRPDVATWRSAILTKLVYALGKEQATATGRDWFLAASLAVRDRIIERWVFPSAHDAVPGRKRVYYLSIEYLIGRLLYDALSNLDLVEPVREALMEMGVDLDQIRDLEADPGLGNGGLGRLAACFMDSLAALQIPAIGYGIRYRYGLFKQQITDGVQEELPDDWLASGNPWEFERREIAYPVSFGGMVEYVGTETARGIWYPSETMQAVAYETPIVGWRGRHVNALRLWSARANEPLSPYGTPADRLRRSGGCQRAGRGDLRHALSKRHHARWTGASATTGVLLHRRFVAGHRSPAPAGPCRSHVAAVGGRNPAQRHPSCDRGGRTDAAPGRRARLLLGGCVDGDDRNAQLHQPHAAAGSARTLAGGST